MFREGAGKCLSTAINRTTDQVVREGERQRERERERERERHIRVDADM